jgi:pimeloyl-ACP methyl ester carboxylesterase
VKQQVGELRALLAPAGIDAPYLPVGHSYGGRIARGLRIIAPLEGQWPTPQPHRPVAAAASKAPGIRPPARPAPQPRETARILRYEVCNRSDDGKPPLELSERTEQILASRDWLSPMKSAS